MRRFLLAFVLFSTFADAQRPVAPKPVAHAAFPAGETTPLGNKIAALLADPSVSRAHWGIAVTALDGTPIYGLDEGKLFRPASNAKLFTTAAAMALLGPERRFITSVTTDGNVDGTTLIGSIVLHGSGDANFAGSYVLPFVAKGDDAVTAPPTLADIDELAAQIATKGIKTIDGAVVGDDRRFEYVPYPPGWAIEDELWGYGAPVSALTVHDNQVDLTVTAGKPRQPVEIKLVPSVTYYTVNQVTNDSGRKPTVNSLDFGSNQVGIARATDMLDVQVFGSVVAKYGPYRAELAIADPAEYAALALKQALERHGITVNGDAKARHSDSEFVGSFREEMMKPEPMVLSLQPGTERGCGSADSVAPQIESTELAKHESAQLSEDVKLTLKVSQNLHAEIMLRNLAGCQSTLRESLRWLRQWLVNSGLDGDDFIFYDGSGLSAKDLVTPRATAKLLSFATTQPWFAQWKSALPIGGVDGTLASRFTTAPLKGHVFAKTGTLGESRALSGYLDCASGKQVIFSIMVDNHTPAGSADRAVMDKIVAAIAAEN